MAVDRILAKVSRFMNANALLAECGPAVVAVSGGPDSVALLDILARLRTGAEGRASARRRPTAGAPRSAPSKVVLVVAHLNHNLRHPDAELDADFVRSLAARYGFLLAMGSANVRELAAKLRKGIEETAREVRYNFLLEVAARLQAERITTGHTMNDQAETFIMRALRGAGAAGLGGMRPLRPALKFGDLPFEVEYVKPKPVTRSVSLPPGPDSAGDKVTPSGRSCEPAAHVGNQTGDRGPADELCTPPPIDPLTELRVRREPKPVMLARPLLCLKRAEIEDYCRERGLEYRVDDSNANAGYLRNRIRNEVIPILSGVRGEAVTALARAADLLAADNRALDEIAERLLAQASAGPEGNDEAILEIPELLGQPAAVRSRVLIKAISKLLPSGLQLTSDRAGAMGELLRKATSGKRIELPGGLVVWLDTDRLRIVKAGVPAYSVSMRLSPGGRAMAGGFLFRFEAADANKSRDELIAQARGENSRAHRNWMAVVLDRERLPDVLVIRPRAAGETVRLAGRSHAKKLKNLMIGHRIPVSRRAAWPVVATESGEVVWSPGMPPSVEFAAQNETRALAILIAIEQAC